MKRTWQVAIGGLCLAFAMLLMAHWFWFPEAVHPPVWLVVLFAAVGVVTLLPVQFTLLVDTAWKFVPVWAGGRGSDRRSGEERRVEDRPFDGPDRRKPVEANPDGSGVVPLGGDL